MADKKIIILIAVLTESAWILPVLVSTNQMETALVIIIAYKQLTAIISRITWMRICVLHSMSVWTFQMKIVMIVQQVNLTLGFDVSNSIGSCAQLCLGTDNCEWWTYDSSNQGCTLFQDCSTTADKRNVMMVVTKQLVCFHSQISRLSQQLVDVVSNNWTQYFKDPFTTLEWNKETLKILISFFTFSQN